MLFLDSQVGDLLEDIIEGMVRMRNHYRSFFREIMVKQVHYLDSYVSFASSRRTNDQRQSFLKRTNYRVHLVFCESHTIPFLHILQFQLIIQEVLLVVLVLNLAEVLLQMVLVNKSVQQGRGSIQFLLLIL